MLVLCAKCGERFESLIIDQKIAWGECFAKSVKHIQNRHHAYFREMSNSVGVAVNALTTVMHAQEFMVVPEENKFGNDAIEAMQTVVMIATGFDVDEEEVEEGAPDEDPPAAEVVEIDSHRGDEPLIHPLKIS